LCTTGGGGAAPAAAIVAAAAAMHLAAQTAAADVRTAGWLAMRRQLAIAGCLLAGREAATHGGERLPQR